MSALRTIIIRRGFEPSVQPVEKKRDWIAFVISIVSFLISILSFYFSTLLVADDIGLVVEHNPPQLPCAAASVRKLDVMEEHATGRLI